MSTFSILINGRGFSWKLRNTLVISTMYMFIFQILCFSLSRYILNFLRNGELLLPNDRIFKEQLLKEAEFYQVQGVISQLKQFSSLFSSIIKDEVYISSLTSWLPSGVSFSLLYRASVDGATPTDFHRCCDNKGPTLVVIKNGENVCGGYTSKSWEPGMT